MAGSKARTLFAIDVIIAIAFIGAAVSAAAFLIPYSIIDFATSSEAPTFLGITYGTWNTLHLYTGLAMIIGGLVHFVMHWGWMYRVAKGMLPGSRRVAVSSNPSAQSTQATAFAEEVHDVQ